MKRKNCRNGDVRRNDSSSKNIEFKNCSVFGTAATLLKFYSDEKGKNEEREREKE